MASSSCPCEHTRAEIPDATLHGAALAQKSFNATRRSLSTEDDVGFSDIDALSAVNALRRHLSGDDDATSLGTRDDLDLFDLDATESIDAVNTNQNGDEHAVSPSEIEMLFQTPQEFEETFHTRFNDMVHAYTDQLDAGRTVVFAPRVRRCGVPLGLNRQMRKAVKRTGLGWTRHYAGGGTISLMRSQLEIHGAPKNTSSVPFCIAEETLSRQREQAMVASPQQFADRFAILFVRYLHQCPKGSLRLSEAHAIIHESTCQYNDILHQASHTIQESGGLRAWLHGYSEYFEVTGQGRRAIVSLAPGVASWASLLLG